MKKVCSDNFYGDFTSAVVNKSLLQIKKGNEFDLAYEKNRKEFWITKNNEPIWRSGTSGYSTIVREWNSRVEPSFSILEQWLTDQLKDKENAATLTPWQNLDLMKVGATTVVTALATYNVVVVEDETALAHVIERICKHDRLIFKVVHTGKDAMARLGWADFVITDSDYQGAEDLLDATIARKMPFVVFTGAGVPTPKAFRNVYKPDFQKLKNAINALIEKLDASFA